MPSAANDPFTARMLQIYDDALKLGYPAVRFKSKVIKVGGVEAAKFWLRPSRPTEGFKRLIELDALHLSVEAVALQPPWNELFTPEELQTARKRLAEVGYTERTLEAARPSTKLSPDEVENEATFPEGAKMRITVNAYERNPEARARCIEHYGAKCYVCDFEFGMTYGEIGQGFIVVHHLRHFSANSDPRLTDPVRDLRPVCPNCHYMLHRQNPPFAITALKKIMGKAQRRARNKQRPVSP